MTHTLLFFLPLLLTLGVVAYELFDLVRKADG